ncbi:hypothetical protein GCM10020358_67190 [Amorphoplanes nipponensis]|uniref:hypothetical protein n=1 Tax=Actinoplanes nipponensis TaxID=135950 RepID=UPI0031E6F204
MKSATFTNSIEVGTEAVAGAGAALAAVRDAVQLAQVLVSAGPAGRRADAARRTHEGFVTATVGREPAGPPGRAVPAAHHAVGAAVYAPRSRPVRPPCRRSPTRPGRHRPPK